MLFEYIRTHTKLMMMLLVLLIFPAFVFLGVGSYSSFMPDQPVAHVGGITITQPELDGRLREETMRIQQTSPGLDIRNLDTPEFRYRVLEEMVRSNVLLEEARDERLSTSDEELSRALLAMPEIMALPRLPDGSIDREAYASLLNSVRPGMTPQAYEAILRRELALQKVMGGVQNSSFATKPQADVSLNAWYETRMVQIHRFATNDFTKEVNPTDEDLRAYYEANQGRFQVPEEASIEYLVFSVGDIAAAVSVNEQDLLAWYEQNGQSLAEPEKRRASHILVSIEPDATDARRNEAKETAQALLEKLRAAPDTFAEVAKSSSQDELTAAKGGDLGYFTRNTYPQPLEDAAFSLARGEISDLVETDFGWHIIQVTDIQRSEPPPFGQARAEIEKRYRDQQARARFSELGDEFKNLVFEDASSLPSIAEKFDLKVRTASGITREPAPDAQGVLASGEFLDKLFAPEILAGQSHTEAVQTDAETLATGRVLQHTEAHTRPFEEVQDDIRMVVTAVQAAAMARSKGEEALALWKANPEKAAEQITETEEEVSRVLPQDPRLVDAVMSADAGNLPVLVGVDLEAEGFAVVRISEIRPRDPAALDEAQAFEQYMLYNRIWSDAEIQAYYDWLKVKHKVQIRLDKP